MIGVYDGKTFDVAPCCEVMHHDTRTTCGKPTTHFYPAHGGGTMALCADCAKPHGKHAWPVV